MTFRIMACTGSLSSPTGCVIETSRTPCFFENPDLEDLLRRRLSQTVVLWPDQAIPLLGYMGWPNDPADRDESLRAW
jgi:hypothetical protein